MSTETIKVYKDLMGANEEWAAKTRELLREKQVTMINIIGSPGAGKTSLLERMTEVLQSRLKFAVLEGDVETTHDAERLAALDLPVSQLLTNGACHLEAKLVHYALRDLPLDELDMVIVENVGNLVCPAEFDIGEKAKIAIACVTEGEDKPVKYPLLFHEASAVVVTKCDLLPHLNFSVEKLVSYLKQVNAKNPIFQVGNGLDEGFNAWLDWVLTQQEYKN